MALHRYIIMLLYTEPKWDKSTVTLMALHYYITMLIYIEHKWIDQTIIRVHLSYKLYIIIAFKKRKKEITISSFSLRQHYNSIDLYSTSWPM